MRKIALEDNLRAHRELTEAIRVVRQAKMHYEQAFRALEESTKDYKSSQEQYRKALEAKTKADAAIIVLRRENGVSEDPTDKY